MATYYVAMPHASRPRHSAVRTGRVLIECCVSLVLLAGASTLVLLLATTTAQVVDDARQQDLALRESMTSEASVLGAPCLAAAGRHQRILNARTRIESNATTSGAMHALSLATHWQTSGLAADSARSLRTSTAGWCE